MFAHQKIDDGPDRVAKCAPDRTELDSEELDQYNTKATAPTATGRNPGKARERRTIRDWSEDDTDDCIALEVLNVEPLAYAYPMPSTSAEPAEQDQQATSSAAANRVPPQQRVDDPGTSAVPEERTQTRKRAGASDPGVAFNSSCSVVCSIEVQVLPPFD